MQVLPTEPSPTTNNFIVKGSLINILLLLRNMYLYIMYIYYRTNVNIDSSRAKYKIKELKW